MASSSSLHVSGLFLVALLAFLSVLSVGRVESQLFDFVPATGSPGWGAIDQFVRATNVPVGFVTGYNSSDADNQWAVAPAGSWLLFGTQPDVSLSTNR